MPRQDPYAEPCKRSGLTPYLDAFLEWSRVTGVSKDTHRRRRSALRRFIAWCEERDIQQPQEITRPILERYQRHLYLYRQTDGRPLSWGTQNVMLTPLKSWFRWLARDNHILGNPASELVIPKKPRTLPKSILSVEEVRHVITLPDTETDEGIRDRAILETLYSTAIRRAELVALDVFDVDANRGILLIREGKGRKDRVVPVGDRALQWIERYRVAGRDDGALFLTNTGKRFRRSALAARVKQYLTQAGIDKPGSCHLFRHACATHMLEHGADIRYIQAILGHANLDTTQIYTRVSIEKLKAIHRATHPGSGVDDGTANSKTAAQSVGVAKPADGVEGERGGE
jgi:integrase/recombinase XerD